MITTAYIQRFAPAPGQNHNILKNSSDIATLILAAGKSLRLRDGGIETLKPLLELPDGDTFLSRAVKNVQGISFPIVIIGCQKEKMTDYCKRNRIPYCVNEEYEKGQTYSLKTGIRNIPGNAEAFFIYPVDYPCVQRETVLHLVDAYHETKKQIIIPAHEGRGGHPVLVSTKLAGEFLALSDEEPAFRVIRRDINRVFRLPVGDAGVLLDVDTVSDYEKILKSEMTIK